MKNVSTISQFRGLPILTFEKPITDSGVSFTNEPGERRGKARLARTSDGLPNFKYIEKLLYAKPHLHTGRLVFWEMAKPSPEKARLFMREAIELLPHYVFEWVSNNNKAYHTEIDFAVANWLIHADKNQNVRDILVELLQTPDRSANMLADTILAQATAYPVQRIRSVARRFVSENAAEVDQFRTHIMAKKLAKKHGISNYWRPGIESLLWLKETESTLDQIIKGKIEADSTENMTVPSHTSLSHLAAIDIHNLRMEVIKAFGTPQKEKAAAGQALKMLHGFTRAEDCIYIENDDEYRLHYWLHTADISKGLIHHIVMACYYLSFDTPYAANALIWFADRGIDEALSLVPAMIETFGEETYKAYIEIASKAVADLHGKTRHLATFIRCAATPVRVMERLAKEGSVPAQLLMPLITKYIFKMHKADTKDKALAAFYELMVDEGII